PCDVTDVQVEADAAAPQLRYIPIDSEQALTVNVDFRPTVRIVQQRSHLNAMPHARLILEWRQRLDNTRPLRPPYIRGDTRPIRRAFGVHCPDYAVRVLELLPQTIDEVGIVHRHVGKRGHTHVEIGLDDAPVVRLEI